MPLRTCRFVVIPLVYRLNFILLKFVESSRRRLEDTAIETVELHYACRGRVKFCQCIRAHAHAGKFKPPEMSKVNLTSTKIDLS